MWQVHDMRLFRFADIFIIRITITFAVSLLHICININRYVVHWEILYVVCRLSIYNIESAVCLSIFYWENDCWHPVSIEDYPVRNDTISCVYMLSIIITYTQKIQSKRNCKSRYSDGLRNSTLLNRDWASKRHMVEPEKPYGAIYRYSYNNKRVPSLLIQFFTTSLLADLIYLACL